MMEAREDLPALVFEFTRQVLYHLAVVRHLPPLPLHFTNWLNVLHSNVFRIASFNILIYINQWIETDIERFLWSPLPGQPAMITSHFRAPANGFLHPTYDKFCSFSCIRFPRLISCHSFFTSPPLNPFKKQSARAIRIIFHFSSVSNSVVKSVENCWKMWKSDDRKEKVSPLAVPSFMICVSFETAIHLFIRSTNYSRALSSNGM